MASQARARATPTSSMSPDRTGSPSRAARAFRWSPKNSGNWAHQEGRAGARPGRDREVALAGFDELGHTEDFGNDCWDPLRDEHLERLETRCRRWDLGDGIHADGVARTSLSENVATVSVSFGCALDADVAKAPARFVGTKAGSVRRCGRPTAVGHDQRRRSRLRTA